MRTLTRVLGWLYIQSLKLYPSGFRNEFEEEMTAVFTQALAVAAAKSGRAVMAVCWHELWGLPGAALRQQLLARRQRYMHTPIDEFPANGHISKRDLVALVIFMIPFLFSLEPLLPGAVMAPIAIFIFFWALAAFVIGVVRGQPRWWFFPYAGLLSGVAVLYLVWVPLLDTGLATFLRRMTPSRDLAGRLSWIAITEGVFWISFLAVLTLAVLLLSTWRPLRPLYWRIRRDWTLLSFFLYGAIPFILIIGFDDYWREEPYLLVVSLCLAAGAWGYTRGHRAWQRALALFAGVALGMTVAAVGKWILVPSQEWPVWFGWHSPESERWVEAWQIAVQGGWMLVALAAPAVLSLLPRPGDSPPVAA